MGILTALVALLLLLTIKGNSAPEEVVPAPGQHIPAASPAVQVKAVGGSQPFQLCLDCRCCAANDPANCSSMPCCFGIDCNLPDKPFGVCAFVPKSCDCTSCS